MSKIHEKAALLVLIESDPHRPSFSAKLFRLLKPESAHLDPLACRKALTVASMRSVGIRGMDDKALPCDILKVIRNFIPENVEATTPSSCFKAR